MAAPDSQHAQAQPILANQALRTPGAAAVAGIAFAILFMISFGMIRLAIPEGIGGTDTHAWLRNGADTVRFSLTLVPFAGIAFLWFMGVVRDRLGELEDQFFSTVFFGSGLLFLAMIFCSAALAGGIVAAYAIDPDALTESGTITFGRIVIYTITNVYAIRMAGVFMLSLGTIWLQTHVMPRFFVIITYVLAIALLLVINLSLWVIMVFPIWVLAVSIFVLVENQRRGRTKAI
jgi:hypothetical protein